MKNLDSLNLTKNQKDIIIDYLNGLKDYVDNHKIDIDVYNDIEGMFIDKISIAEKLDDFYIKKSIKEVWNAEDIFGEYSSIDDDKKSKKEIFYKKLIKTDWIRDNNWAILLWISSLLSRKIWISIFAVRVLLIIFILFWGLSIWFYFLAWLILPIKGVDYKTEKTFNYLSIQFVYLIRNLVCNFTIFIRKNLFLILWKVIVIIKYIVSFIKNNIFPIFRFILFLLIAWFIFFILISLLVVSSAYFSDFTLWNIDFFSVFPAYFIYWTLFWILSLTILFIWSIWYWLNKKVFNKYIYYFSIISLLVFIFLSISTWFSLLKTYIWNNSIIKTASINLESYWTWNINIDLSKLDKIELDWFNNNYYWLNIIEWSWSTIKAVLNYEVIWNDWIYNSINNNLNELKFNFNDWNLDLSYTDWKIFREKVPFTFIDIEIDLYLPKSNTYYIDWVRYYFHNVSVNDNFIYWDYLYQDCRYELIYYSENFKDFRCSASDYNIEKAKNKFIINNLILNYDNYSDIKHVDEYKRTYYSDYGISSDWFFDDIEINENNINFEFSDRSLEIESKINYSLSSTWVIFDDFKVLDIEANYNYDDKYYLPNDYEIKKD